jgi:hypothetical protein
MTRRCIAHDGQRYCARSVPKTKIPLCSKHHRGLALFMAMCMRDIDREQRARSIKKRRAA